MVGKSGTAKGITNDAEGADRSTSRRGEPGSPTRTTTMPVVRGATPREKPLSETGLTEVVTLSAEGRDQTDAQDAARSHEETHPDQASAYGRIMDEDMPPILIVEDTVELAEVVQATIENMGYNAVYETHGMNGLNRLKEIQPELVILDIGLPDITGWKMLDHIKEYYTSIDKPLPAIIVVTAYGDPANRLIGKLQNIHSYLIKPFTPDEVEELVAMALRGEKPSSDDIANK